MVSIEKSKNNYHMKNIMNFDLTEVTQTFTEKVSYKKK